MCFELEILGNAYRPTSIGPPKAVKFAIFDIITPDLINGPNAAAAEGITIVNNCLDMFGDLSEHYILVLSHSKSK